MTGTRTGRPRSDDSWGRMRMPNRVLRAAADALLVALAAFRGDGIKLTVSLAENDPRAPVTAEYHH